MENQGEIFSLGEVYVKEILCRLSYLFYARKPLISLLNHAENQGKITGIRVARANPSISHLLFADDSMFFCEVKPREYEEVMKVVREYGKA